MVGKVSGVLGSVVGVGSVGETVAGMVVGMVFSCVGTEEKHPVKNKKSKHSRKITYFFIGIPRKERISRL